MWSVSLPGVWEENLINSRSMTEFILTLHKHIVLWVYFMMFPFLFKTALLYYCLLCVCVYVCMHTTVHMWSEDSFLRSVSTFHHVGPRDFITRLDSNVFRSVFPAPPDCILLGTFLIWRCLICYVAA